MSSTEYVLVKPSVDKGFEPEKWNNPPAGLTRCFAYALNSPAIGDTYGDFETAAMRDEYEKNGLSHNITSITKGGLCTKFPFTDIRRSYALKAHFAGLKRVDLKEYTPQQGDYIFAVNHFLMHHLRRHDDGTWTHNPHFNSATNLDGAGNIITNLSKAEFVYDNQLVRLQDLPDENGGTDCYLMSEKGVLIRKCDF